MMKIEDIFKYIDNEEYDEAETAVRALLKNDYRNPYLNYLLGYIYESYQNPKHSATRAREYYNIAIDSEHPIEDAFLRLSFLERNTGHAARILKKGITYFQNSSSLYNRLLTITKEKDREIVFNEILQKDLTNTLSLRTMITTYVPLERFDTALKLIAQIKSKDKSTSLVLPLLEGLCSLGINKLNTAKKIFKNLIEEDINHRLEYAPYFCLILAYLFEKRTEAALNVFSEVPGEIEFEPPFEPLSSPLDFDYFDLTLKTLAAILNATRNKKICAKARGLRGLLIYAFSGGDYYKQKTKITGDLSFANKQIPTNKKYCEKLFELKYEDGDFFNAYKLAKQYMNNLSWSELKEDQINIHFSFVEEASEEVFQQFLNDLKKDFNNIDSASLALAKGLINPIIERLHKKNDFETIIELVDPYMGIYLEETNVLFEIAYAYGELKKNEAARKTYELYLKKEGESSAAINNLGVVYEKEGNLAKAEECFERALRREPHSKRYKNNLQCINNLRKSAKLFQDEDIKRKSIAFILWQRINLDNLIGIKKRDLPRILSLPTDETKKTIKYFLEQQYLSEISDNNFPNDFYVFKFNPEVQLQIPNIEREVEKENEITELTGNITSEGLRNIGYNDDLIHSLRKKVISKDLQGMLQRDLREAAVAFLAKSYKTSLIMCGSIIESVLVDILLSRKINKYKMENGRNRSVLRMDLDDLLFVTLKEGFIDVQLSHLGHALRGFRNLIHPGVEQRKQAISVSESNARIAWDITRKIILEL